MILGSPRKAPIQHNDEDQEDEIDGRVEEHRPVPAPDHKLKLPDPTESQGSNLNWNVAMSWRNTAEANFLASSSWYFV
jgi:hypothetical protein